MGQPFKEFREKAGLSLEESARRTGLEKTMLAQIENGVIIVDGRDLIKIFEALVPANDLSRMDFIFDFLAKALPFKPIDKRILPLVQVIEETKMIRMIECCEGHYYSREQQQKDRNFAFVRFDNHLNVPAERIDKLLLYILSQVSEKARFVVEVFRQYWAPTSPELVAAIEKRYPGTILETPWNFVVKITPRGRFERPRLKRKVTDEGILEVTRVVREAVEKGIYK